MAIEETTCERCGRRIMVHWFNRNGRAFCDPPGEPGRQPGSEKAKRSRRESTFTAAERERVYQILGRRVPLRLRDQAASERVHT